MNVLLDIIFTLIEGCCFLYLMKDEKIKWIRQGLFLVLFLFICYILTQKFTLSKMGIKIVFSYSFPILLEILILALPLKKSVFYTTIYAFLVMASEMIIANVGLLFHISPGLKEDTSMSIVHAITGKILCVTCLIIVHKIVSDIHRKRFDVKILFFFVSANIGYIIVAMCIYIYSLYRGGRIQQCIFNLFRCYVNCIYDKYFLFR